MRPVLRNFLRGLTLLGAIGLLAVGMVSGALPGSPTDPPNDSVWLLCLAGAFPLLMLYASLSVSPVHGPSSPEGSEARFRRNVQQLGGFLLVGFGLLSLHLLREQ